MHRIAESFLMQIMCLILILVPEIKIYLNYITLSNYFNSLIDYIYTLTKF